MFLPRSLCEDVISTLESHVSPSGDSHHNHRHKHPQALAALGMCPLPPQASRNIPIYTIYFSPACIGQIALDPFFNQLLLSVNNFISRDMGYALQHYLYYFIVFHYLLAQQHMGHTIADPAQVQEIRDLCVGPNVDQKRRYLCFLVKQRKRKNTEQ